MSCNLRMWISAYLDQSIQVTNLNTCMYVRHIPNACNILYSQYSCYIEITMCSTNFPGPTVYSKTSTGIHVLEHNQLMLVLVFLMLLHKLYCWQTNGQYIHVFRSE